MTFAAHMRVGSLEILAATALVAFVLGRRHSAPDEHDGSAMRVALRVEDPLGAVPRTLTLRLDALQPVATIGRAAEADVPLRDPEVSRRHARFQWAGSILYVRDLESRNGTFLDGKRLEGEGIEARPGDYIDVGNTRITILELDTAP